MKILIQRIQASSQYSFAWQLINDLLFPELDSVKLNTWIEGGQLTPGETYYGDIHYVSEDLWDAMPARIAKELVELPTFEEVPKGRWKSGKDLGPEDVWLVVINISRLDVWQPWELFIRYGYLLH